MKRIQTPSMFAVLLAASLLLPTPNQAVAATRPTLIITYPTVNLSVTNAAITLSGKTSGKVSVTNVLYQLNGTGWNPAATANAWANWTAGVTLTTLGANSVRAYAVDSNGNHSLTNTVRFTYAPTALLTVQVTGIGTVTPNDNGKWLKIGAHYSMTAKAGKGFGFLKWFGSLSTNQPTLSFVMASNLTFIAKFVDVTPPVLVILSPKVHQNVSNALFTVTGKASDNVGVTQVFCQLNAAGWEMADSANGRTNWTAQVTPSPGTNLVAAYAEDAAGNRSKTNSVSFVYHSSAPADWAPASLSGLSAVVTSPGGPNSFGMSFGAGTLSVTMLPGTNEDKNSVGNYTYAKLSSDTALLTINPTAPPDRTNDPVVVGLTFTSSQNATFISTNRNGVGTGAIRFSQAPDLAPASVAGETVRLVDSANGHTATIVLNSNATFKLTDNSGHVTSGPYTFTRYSPVGALLMTNITSPTTEAGAVNDVLLTFSAPKAGTYFVLFFDLAGETDSSSGTFTLH